MAEENISQELRLKNIHEARNYLIEEITRNELMNKKHKKISKITKCVSISAFASLIGIPIGITSSAIGLQICAITAGIKSISQ